MLYQTVISPKLLEDIPVDPLPTRLFCNLWLGILTGLVENGSIVLPQNHVADSDYLNAVSTWPPKYRKRAQELLSALKSRRRILVSPVPCTPPASCIEPGCQPFTAASLANTDAFFFSKDSCSGCPTLAPLASRLIEPLDYFVSEFSRVRSKRSSLVLRDGQWKDADFEREVLAAVLRTAKHVKIYDRYIGRSVVDRGAGTVTIKDNYKKTLEWIVDIFRRVGGHTRGGVFEIYCGVEASAVSPAKRSLVRNELNNLQAFLQVKLGGPVRIVIKQETKTAQCPHGRYLLTDQVALLVERGFDLLWNDANMIAAGLDPQRDPRPIRDVAVVLCDDCAAVETHTKALPNY